MSKGFFSQIGLAILVAVLAGIVSFPLASLLIVVLPFGSVIPMGVFASVRIGLQAGAFLLLAGFGLYRYWGRRVFRYALLVLSFAYLVVLLVL